VERALVERWAATPEQAKLLARLSAGCLGWAASASLDESILNERAEQLNSLLQITNKGRVERFAYASRLSSQFPKNHGAVRDILSLWVEWWRDLLLVKGGCSDFITNIDRESTLYSEADRYHLTGIKGFIRSLQQTMEALGQNANPRLVLEVLMLDIPEREGGLVSKT
jgi:DNA polymerase-3 subunit delta'